MLCGWLAHVLLSLVMWSGVVVYGWLARWLAQYMSMAVCMAVWLALWLSFKPKRFWRENFSAFSASKSPKNAFKITAKSAEILADFSLIFALQKPKPKNPKPASKT
jgi:hypothetical protein